MQGTLDNVLDIPHPVHTKKLVSYQTHMLSHFPGRRGENRRHKRCIDPYLAVIERVSSPAHHIQNIVSLLHLTVNAVQNGVVWDTMQKVGTWFPSNQGPLHHNPGSSILELGN